MTREQVMHDIRHLPDNRYAAKYGMCGGCGRDVGLCCGGCAAEICRECPDRIAEGWFK